MDIVVFITRVRVRKLIRFVIKLSLYTLPMWYSFWSWEKYTFLTALDFNNATLVWLPMTHSMWGMGTRSGYINITATFFCLIVGHTFNLPTPHVGRVIYRTSRACEMINPMVWSSVVYILWEICWGIGVQTCVLNHVFPLDEECHPRVL